MKGSANASVSVVIAAYNARAFVAEALDSVFAQTLRPLEVVVVDDGSVDDTASVVARYRFGADRMAAYQSRVRQVLPQADNSNAVPIGDEPEIVFLQQPNRGPAAARNLGIERTRSEWIAFLDADDAWLPWTVATLLHAASMEPEAVLAFGDALNFGTNGAEGYAVGEWQVPLGRWARPFQILAEDNRVLTGALLARAAAIRQLGGFRETMKYGEDHHLWLRLALCAPFVRCAEVMLLRRRHGQSLSVHQDAFYEAKVPMLQELGKEYGALLAQQDVELGRAVEGAWLRLVRHYRWSGRPLRAFLAWLRWKGQRRASLGRGLPGTHGREVVR